MPIVRGERRREGIRWRDRADDPVSAPPTSSARRRRRGGGGGTATLHRARPPSRRWTRRDDHRLAEGQGFVVAAPRDGVGDSVYTRCRRLRTRLRTEVTRRSNRTGDEIVVRVVSTPAARRRAATMSLTWRTTSRRVPRAHRRDVAPVTWDRRSPSGHDRSRDRSSSGANACSSSCRVRLRVRANPIRGSRCSFSPNRRGGHSLSSHEQRHSAGQRSLRCRHDDATLIIGARPRPAVTRDAEAPNVVPPTGKPPPSPQLVSSDKAAAVGRHGARPRCYGARSFTARVRSFLRGALRCDHTLQDGAMSARMASPGVRVAGAAVGVYFSSLFAARSRGVRSPGSSRELTFDKMSRQQ